jgi:hypothetical protein
MQIQHAARLLFAPAFLGFALGTIPVTHAGVALNADASTFGATVAVHPTGTPTENAAALTAALQSPTAVAATEGSPVLIDIGPGIFDFGSGTSLDPFTSIAIEMPDHVHLRGAGTDITVLTCTCDIVIYANFTTDNQFSQLTIDSLGDNREGNLQAAIYALGAAIGLKNVVTRGDYGVYLQVSTAEIWQSTLLSSLNYALYLSFGGEATVTHSVIDGLNSNGRGIVAASGVDNILNIRYSYVGDAGMEAGLSTCLATTTASSFIPTGCPTPPVAASADGT